MGAYGIVAAEVGEMMHQAALKTRTLKKREYTKTRVLSELEAFVEELTDTTMIPCTTSEFADLMCKYEPAWRAWRPSHYQHARVLGAVLQICLATRHGEEEWAAAVDAARAALPGGEWQGAVLPRLRALGLAPREGRPPVARTGSAPGVWAEAERAVQGVLAADRRSLGRAADAEVGLGDAPSEREIAMRWAEAGRRALARAERRPRVARRSRTAHPTDLDRAAEKIFAILRQ